MSKIRKNKFLSILLLIILITFIFFIFKFSYIKKETFFKCEVGMVRLDGAPFDGGPEIMTLNFNLKIKLPIAFIYNPSRGSGFSYPEGAYNGKENRDDIVFNIKWDDNNHIYIPSLKFEYSETLFIESFRINRSNLKIEDIDIVRSRDGLKMSEFRKVGYSNCEETAEPKNKI